MSSEQEHSGSYRDREEIMTGKANDSQVQDLKNRKHNNLITEGGICWFAINASDEKQHQVRKIVQVKTNICSSG